MVQNVVESLLQVPETAHAAVRYTTLLLLGELGEWMDKHPVVVGKCSQFLRHSNDQFVHLSLNNCRTSAPLRITFHQRPFLVCGSLQLIRSHH